MDAPRPITPPGWYDDGHGQLRWWDGSQWTQHTAPLAQQAPPQQQAPQPAAQPAQAPRPTGDLVAVKRSKLAWILPLVLLAAALIGSLSAVAVWSAAGGDAEPLERTYAAYARAEVTKDCATLQATTTASFRDDLTDGPFTCAEWASQRPAAPGSAKWGARLGPIGVLIVEQRYSGFLDDEESMNGSTLTTYTFIREGGRWKLDDGDGDD
ncbi:DUF2510 domain-containing protein [Aeromicrobium duanguangcaii]|uniref:DUF2510 domain-containing protein n=1 Tax=Aeromicrobium duanguangcaii TaxID=2968086 RepID=A0ABY5KBV7_9ACTN|nr:DUF2510 domain-containing protein [Aeromicrobium duanguangcaii]MCD9154634.1 DUF2510 domain-containing protein [Aeromicrobium duanguangcaii]UUI67951.1 DUF2510 domain-containing protein [Aeromicrobium duanguangcaii]